MVGGLLWAWAGLSGCGESRLEKAEPVLEVGEEDESRSSAEGPGVGPDSGEGTVNLDAGTVTRANDTSERANENDRVVEANAGSGCDSSEPGPACGGDGVLYANMCELEAAGQRLVAGALCGNAPTESCDMPLPPPVFAADMQVIENPYCEVDWGNPCGTPDLPACPEQQYCDFLDADQCGQAGSGICLPWPALCLYSRTGPVCGCDGNTYEDACTIHFSGVAVASEGACERTGQPCGGEFGETCGDGEFCDHDRLRRCVNGDCSDGSQFERVCGGDGEVGNCRVIPKACPAGHDPVCGCDGQTYDSVCFAQHAGVSVAFRQPCQ